MDRFLENAPIKVNPYEHQKSAFNFALKRCGLVGGGDANTPLKRHGTCALLMEMSYRNR